MGYNIVDGLRVSAEDIGEDTVKLILFLILLFIVLFNFVNKSFSDNLCLPLGPVDFLT